LNTWIFDDLLSSKYLKEQGFFHNEAIQLLKKQLHSSNPGDSAARIWALIVFQSWYNKRLK
jgi:asparagine synthase (glutamine-hydrolysing)